MGRRAAGARRGRRPASAGLDAAVLVRALTFPGSPAESAYREVLEGRAELVASPSRLAEVGRALHALGWGPDAVEEAVAQLVRVARVVRPADGDDDDPTARPGRPWPARGAVG